jgi:acyl phosphate:glycerol-3-phosphate acyltransferase
MLLLVLLSVGAYLLGSVSSAIIVSGLMGLPDPRTSGSKNPGATNMLRIGGKRAGVITLAGDLLKGLLPVALTAWLNAGDLAIALVGLGAFLGHLYPLYFGFHGGKGVATYIGVLYGYGWKVGALFMAQWCLVAYLFRYSSLAALVSAACSPFAVYWLVGRWEYFATAIVMTSLLFLRHQENIRRLLRGEESRLGSRTSADR